MTAKGHAVIIGWLPQVTHKLSDDCCTSHNRHLMANACQKWSDYRRNFTWQPWQHLWWRKTRRKPGITEVLLQPESRNKSNFNGKKSKKISTWKQESRELLDCLLLSEGFVACSERESLLASFILLKNKQLSRSEHFAKDEHKIPLVCLQIRESCMPQAP